MGLLDGKVGIITGAASGIGAATARVLAREGAKLVLTDLDDAAGLAWPRRSAGVYLHHDVTEEDGWPAVIAAAENASGGSTSWWPTPASASWAMPSTCR